MGDFVGEAVTEFHRYTFEVAATVAPEFTRAGGQSPLEPAAVVVADVPHQVIIGGTPAIRSDTADATLAGRGTTEDADRVNEVVPVPPPSVDLGGLNPDVVTEVLVDVSTDRGVVGVVMRDVGVDVIPGAADLLCEVPLQGVEVLIEPLTLSPPSSGVLRTHTASARSLVVLGDALTSAIQDLVILTPGADPRARHQNF